MSMSSYSNEPIIDVIPWNDFLAGVANRLAETIILLESDEFLLQAKNDPSLYESKFARIL